MIRLILRTWSISEEAQDRALITCPGRSTRMLTSYLHLTTILLIVGNRKSLKIDWTKCILIFDEAHNLESLCADDASFDLPSGILTACIAEAKNCIDLSVARRDTCNDKSCTPENFAILKALLSKLEEKIAEVPIASKDLGFTKDGPYIYELLSGLNITQQTANMLIGTIEKACELLEEDTNVSVNKGSHKTTGTTSTLESMADILGLIFKDNNSTAHAQYYRIHIQEVEASPTDAFRGKTSRTLSWWCFNPGIAMEEFYRLGVRSIILTSGTLSPMDSFAEELKLRNQIWAGVAPAGPSGYAFNSSYRSRGSIEYKMELGNAIVNFARIVPDGLLVFFPSYYLLEQCINCWKAMDQPNLSNSTTIWERICRHKLPVVEPRQSSLFPVAIEDYMTKLKQTSSGAVFFCSVPWQVCNINCYKVSEGLDFADHAGRAVVITGLPFATLTDPKIRLKREYLDHQTQSRKSISKGLTGEEWYSQQTLRAINQAIGRVIRHRHDYGAIILCDERFAHSNSQSQISSWIRPHVKCYSKFGDVVYTLTRFFRDARTFKSPKLEFAQNEYQEHVRVLQSSQPLNNIHLEKLQKIEVNPTSSLDSVSTVKQVKQGSIFNHLQDILPANRSSLASGKLLHGLKMKSSSDLARTGKESLISDERSIQDYNEEAVDLVAPILLKKRKLLITGPDQSKHGEKPDHISIVVKNEHLKFSENVHDLTEESTVELNIMKHKNGVSETVSQSSNAVKGSAYLKEVQEKLTGAEYREFTGLLKSLKSKSKAMKIGHVLQLIAGLFSRPDRLSLLHGFFLKNIILCTINTLALIAMQLVFKMN
ncbi:Regulator of telomere elongation helicase 1 [Orobanche minor]